MSDPAAGEELLLPGGLSRGKSTIRHNAPAPRLPAPVKKRPGFDGFAGLPPRPPASLFAAGPPPPPPPPLDVLPERKAGTSSAIRLNAQAPEYAPRLPAPVKQPVFIDGFAGPSPRPPVSIFLAGPPPPPPLVDVVPGHKGGGGSAPPQHGGRGANTATLLHSSTNLGSAGRSYVLPERKAGTSSAIRLNAQAPEFAPRLPAPVKQTVFIDGFAGPSPRPPVSIFLAGPPPPPPPPPLVDVVPGHKGGGGSAPPQHGGKGVNTANLLHGNTNLGSAGRSYVKLYKNVNIAPEPLDQGQDGTCNFFAVAKGLQMKVHKNYVDHSKDCDIITYPNASMRDYCAMRNIRKCDINHPVKDWNKDVRLQKIEYLAKHRGIEAVSGQWPSPERIKLDELVFLGRNISHSQLSYLLNNGEPIMCQIITGPGFNKLRPNQVWSCKPRFDENWELLPPFAYHVVVLVHCGGRKDPVTFLNSGGRGFGHLGYGFIKLRDVHWLYSFKVFYPLKFARVPGRSSYQAWRLDNTGASTFQLINGSSSTAVDGQSCRSNTVAASSSRSKGKEAIQQKPRGSSTHSSRSQLPPQDRTGIDGPRWHRSSIPAAALPRQSQLAMRDRSAVDDAPTWSRNNFAAATFRSTEGSSSSMCQALQDQSQAPSSKEIKCAPGTAATKGGSKMSESRPEPTSSRTTLC